MIPTLLALFLTASPNAEDFLLSRAAAAKTAGDQETMTAALRGWASLGPRGALPPALEREAATALLWAEGEGRFRLFASRLEDRVRVGVQDPAELVDHIEAFALIDGETIRIARTENEASGRLEFRIAQPGATVRVTAVMKRFGGEVIIARAELAPSEKAALPKVPDKSAFKRETAAIETAPVKDDALPWWWIAAGAAAACLAGAAIWQETRF